ncbi:kinase-like protein [Cadophora sp. DSE1049]|nr:kinase-like protein [Cadophora sp. DSE1049]
MSVPTPLPYRRDTNDLPAELPSTEEILASTEILKGVEAWADRKVVGVGKHFIVKYGAHNDQLEGDNLLFIERQQLGALAPRLYAMWRNDDGILFLVMERLSGVTLENLWPTLREADKEKILCRLKEAFAKLRAVHHGGYFGSVTQSHIPHHLFYWPQYPAPISGPFETEASLVHGLIQKSQMTAQQNKRHSYMADFFSGQLTRDLIKDGRQPVFTHSDLQRKNVLVEEIRAGNEREFRVRLVDWESAGWYPAYWEYVAAFFAFKWDDDWCVKVAEIIDAWPAEAAMMKLIYQDLWL